MASKTCAHCHGSAFRRLNRKGWLQRVLLPKLGVYPWECVQCRRRRYYHDPGPQESGRGGQATFR